MGRGGCLSRAICVELFFRLFSSFSRLWCLAPCPSHACLLIPPPFSGATKSTGRLPQSLPRSQLGRVSAGHGQKQNHTRLLRLTKGRPSLLPAGTSCALHRRRRKRRSRQRSGRWTPQRKASPRRRRRHDVRGRAPRHASRNLGSFSKRATWRPKSRRTKGTSYSRNRGSTKGR